MKLGQILEKPIITEKSMNDASRGIFTFRVSLSATKGSIANEVEKVFGVNVVNVKTAITMSKKRRMFNRREQVKAANWKKAIVKLKEGQKIDLFEAK